MWGTPFIALLTISAPSSSDPPEQRLLTAQELDSLRGGVVITFTFPTGPQTLYPYDNIQVSIDVASAREMNPEHVYFFHGSTKTKSRTVPLNTQYEGSAQLRVPLRPDRLADIEARFGETNCTEWWCDCENSYCFSGAVEDQRLDPTVRYRSIRFHNTKSPAAPHPETAMLAKHGQRFVDDAAHHWGISHHNNDWIFLGCATNRRQVIGLKNGLHNIEAFDNTLFPVSLIPWVFVPRPPPLPPLLRDCTDISWLPLTPSQDAPDYTLFNQYCVPRFQAVADDIDPQRDDIHVFVLRGMKNPPTYIVGGFVLQTGGLIFLHQPLALGSPPNFDDDENMAARLFTHEVGHALGLGHRDDADPQCIAVGDPNNALMCSAKGPGTKVNSTECNTTYFNSSFRDYN